MAKLPAQVKQVKNKFAQLLSQFLARLTKKMSLATVPKMKSAQRVMREKMWETNFVHPPGCSRTDFLLKLRLKHFSV